MCILMKWVNGRFWEPKANTFLPIIIVQICQALPMYVFESFFPQVTCAFVFKIRTKFFHGSKTLFMCLYSVVEDVDPWIQLCRQQCFESPSSFWRVSYFLKAPIPWQGAMLSSKPSLHHADIRYVIFGNIETHWKLKEFHY